MSRRANFNRTVLAISGKIVHDKEEELWGPKERQKSGFFVHSVVSQNTISYKMFLEKICFLSYSTDNRLAAIPVLQFIKKV